MTGTRETEEMQSVHLRADLDRFKLKELLSGSAWFVSLNSDALFTLKSFTPDQQS